MKNLSSLGILCLWGLLSHAQEGKHPEALTMPRTDSVSASPVLVENYCPQMCDRPEGRLRSGMRCLLDWLSFRRTPDNGACSCKVCTPCCRPQLHAFFLHRCRACPEDNQAGIPITFSYTNLLHQSGPCLTGHGCAHGGCVGCK
jgi:hypothetical protein